MDPTKITPEFLANLLEKSRAATKGPWITDEKEKPRSYDADYDTCNYDVVAVDPATDKITTTVSLDLGDDDAMFIAAANPAAVELMVKRLVQLEVATLEQDLLRAEGVLRMLRGEYQDFTNLCSFEELQAEGLDEPAEPDGKLAGIWASFIERKQLDKEKYQKLLEQPLNLEFKQEEPQAQQSQKESQFLNYYSCKDCGYRWNDKWDCKCNDKCPSCNKEIEPYASVELLD
jgi:rubrerythrin